MRLVTEEFGELEIPESEIIYFPKGIIGFEKYKKFYLFKHKDFQPFYWLISVENPALHLPVIDPMESVEEDLQDVLLKQLQNKLRNDADIEIVSIVNINSAQGSVTVNLKGPILIDYSLQYGEQLVLEDDRLKVDVKLV